MVQSFWDVSKWYTSAHWEIWSIVSLTLSKVTLMSHIPIHFVLIQLLIKPEKWHMKPFNCTLKEWRIELESCSVRENKIQPKSMPTSRQKQSFHPSQVKEDKEKEPIPDYKIK